MMKLTRSCDIDQCTASEDYFGAGTSANSLRSRERNGWTTRKATIGAGTRMIFDLCPAHSTSIPAGTRITPHLWPQYR